MTLGEAHELATRLVTELNAVDVSGLLPHGYLMRPFQSRVLFEQEVVRGGVYTADGMMSTFDISVSPLWLGNDRLRVTLRQLVAVNVDSMARLRAERGANPFTLTITAGSRVEIAPTEEGNSQA